MALLRPPGYIHSYIFFLLGCFTNRSAQRLRAVPAPHLDLPLPYAAADRQVPSVETEPVLDLNERDAPIPAASAPRRRFPDDATLPADAASETGGHCPNANARDRGSQENGDSEHDSASFCPPTSTAPPGDRSPGARNDEILTAAVPLGIEAAPGSHESSSNGSNKRSDGGVLAAAQGAEASPPSHVQDSSLAEGETTVPVDADSSSSSSEEFESRPPSPSFSPVEPLPASDSEDDVKLSRASPRKETVAGGAAGDGSSGGAEADRDRGAPADEGVPATATTTPPTAPRITPSQSRPSPQRRQRAPLDATLHDAAARVDAEGMATEQELLEALRARERGEGAQTAPGVNKGEDDGTAAPGEGELKAETKAETKAADRGGGDDNAGLAAMGTAAGDAAAAAASMLAGDVPGARGAAFSVLDRDDVIFSRHNFLCFLVTFFFFAI